MSDFRPTMDGAQVWELSLQPETDSDDQNRIRLAKSPFEVGRGGPRDLVIACPHVSKLHALFEVQGKKLLLRDQGSTNGTFVNGVRRSDCVELQVGDIVQFGSHEYRVGIEAELPPTETMSVEYSAVFRNTLEFRQVIKERAIVPSFQAVINPFSRRALGYEVLVRSTRDGLCGAGELFVAAARVGMEAELSELSRSVGMAHARHLPETALRFLNTHPSELGSSKLVPSLAALREENPHAPIVLEIHESAVCNPKMIKEFSRELQQLEIGLAYDDFGQGQSRILELIEAPSDFLKFDMELIRSIDQAPKSRQNLLASLVQLAKDVGTLSIAEGVETLAEVQACQQLGFDLVQGYFYGRPQPIEWIVADLASEKFEGVDEDPSATDGATTYLHTISS